MKEETKNRLYDMIDAKPLDNPCPKMRELGYNYNYVKGFVDETPYYTRVEEDRIIYTGERYNIQFNLASKDVVLIMHDDNANCYGDKPTFFITEELGECIDEIVEKLGWKE